MIGCSSFTMETKDKKHFLSRTMDFMMEMAEQVVFVPKNKTFAISYDSKQEITSKHSFIGMGSIQRDIDDAPVTCDGINDAGLMGAVLYFPGYASYADKATNNAWAVSPDKVISAVLSQADSLNDIEDLFTKKMVIVNEASPALKVIPPLHYIFSDETGASIIIETQTDGIHVIKDSIGVMTNSPDYHWHETNLRNYLSVTTNQHKDIKFLGKTLKPFSQGSGTFGLPGDFTPTSRFIRTAFMKNNAEQPKDELAGVSLAHHILESVSIPRGIVVTPEDTFDYTCYSAYMCAETRSYYYSTYGNQRIRCVKLTPELEQETEYHEFKVNPTEDIEYMN
ncbi:MULTISPECIES: choloylglycine hydrolase family protein [unclassified Lactobacillus]|uniref:choloylglycine hydrolase family protein n=1 Tax=unclassified Lactobacillus TaxID=2620435 RepID=UPI000EFC5B8C|nr:MULTISPECIES: choloylglycine hydrolase family protein [unclassified Lactobacillus]RMC24895.1 linear amide C-N hydrolase [Lactobacillus sp. ESL0247]RMC29049.1 linear amide C-N hydrolase [Lactobacillus sp. ESL0246]RMC32652.1 linear amide C-N hydrolase [Lactobacillus sp. ESL0245]RMC49554.1 linear amide C-N hydrolase [Lactobacillus sp. ESL0228]